MGNQKVIHLIQSTSGGGAENAARLIARHQSSHYQVEIVTWNPEKNPHYVEEVHYVLITKRQSGFIGLLKVCSKLRKHLSKSKPKAIICHMTYSLVLGRLALLFVYPKPKIIYVHHSSFTPKLGNLPKLLLKVAFRKVQVVAVSESSRKSLLKFKEGLGTTVFPNPVELPPSRSPLEIRKSDNRVTLIAVGRIAPVKNYQFLLEALSFLDDRFVLEIVGDGDSASLKTSVEKMGLLGRVKFLGWLPSNEVLARLRNCDVFVMTSDLEGEPTALLEAAAVGLQIVGRNTPGLGDAVRKVDGYLPKEDTPAELSKTIEFVSQLDLSGTSPKDWRKHHDIETSSHKYCELIERI